MTGRKSFFYHLDQYLYIRNQLEQEVPKNWTTDRYGYFKGISSRFWSYYSYHKELQSEEYERLRAMVTKYFRLAGSFERKGLNYPKMYGVIKLGELLEG